LNNRLLIRLQVHPPEQVRDSEAVRHGYMGTQRDEIMPALAAAEAAAP
jgi:branched-chain amino acid transport system ATP-binding protein